MLTHIPVEIRVPTRLEIRIPWYMYIHKQLLALFGKIGQLGLGRGIRFGGVA